MKPSNYVSARPMPKNKGTDIPNQKRTNLIVVYYDANATLGHTIERIVRRLVPDEVVETSIVHCVTIGVDSSSYVRSIEDILKARPEINALWVIDMSPSHSAEDHTNGYMGNSEFIMACYMVANPMHKKFTAWVRTPTDFRKITEDITEHKPSDKMNPHDIAKLFTRISDGFQPDEFSFNSIYVLLSLKNCDPITFADIGSVMREEICPAKIATIAHKKVCDITYPELLALWYYYTKNIINGML